MYKYTWFLFTFLLLFAEMGAFCDVDLNAEISSSAGYYATQQESDPYNSFSYLMLTPGLSLKASSSKTILNSQMTINLSRYGGSSELSLQNSIISANAKYKLSSNISVEADERFFISGKLKSVGNVTEDELRHIFTNRNTIINDWRNRIIYTLRPTKTSMHLGYSNRFISYRGDETTNTLITNTGQIGVSQAVGNKLTFQVIFNFARKSFNGGDVEFFSVPISVTYTQMLFNRINAQASLGLRSHGYLEQGTSYLKPTAQISVTGKILDNITASTSFRKTVSESSGTNRYTVNNTIASGLLNVILLRSLYWTAYLSYSRNDYLDMKASYETLGFNMGLRYNFRKLGSLSLNYGYYWFEPEFDAVLIVKHHKHHTLFSSYTVSF